MSRFAEPVFIAAGLRTPFGRGGGALANYDAVSLSVPVVEEMAKLAEPDLTIWGTVIPNLGWSNIAREIWLDAKLNPNVPAFAVVLACSTSMTASFAAAGMLGGGLNLILVGGSEVMSRPSLALTAEASKRLTDLFAQDPAAALAALGALTPQDYVLPTKGWANRLTGRTMGDHMEETAKAWRISREAQDDWALKSHQRAVAGWDGGFFADLVISLPELSRDANPRADTSARWKRRCCKPLPVSPAKVSNSAGSQRPVSASQPCRQPWSKSARPFGAATIPQRWLRRPPPLSAERSPLTEPGSDPSTRTSIRLTSKLIGRRRGR